MQLKDSLHNLEHISGVRPQILASVAMKNLLAKRLRTLLTIGGITIGVGAVVFLASLAIGLHSVVDKQVLGSRSVKAIDVTSPNAAIIHMDSKNLNKINQFAHVSKTSSAFILPGKISKQNSLTDAVLYGTDNNYLNLSALKIVAGNGQFTKPHDAIVSTALLNLIGQKDIKSALNQSLNIEATINSNDQTAKPKDFSSELRIIGVVNLGSGVSVYMPSELLQKAGMTEYGQIKVVADSRDNVASIRSQISGLGLTSESPLDTLGEINNIFTIFTFVVIGFGGIGMIIAILGMFNTLTISLLERTSEIGLLITMGASKSTVKYLLIFEALLLSALGGTAGIFVAWLLGQIVNIVLTRLGSKQGPQEAIHVFSVTPLLVFLTLIFTLLVGLLVAQYPARRAAKINPIQALRYE